MNEDQNRAAQQLLDELWQGNVTDVPRVAAFDPSPVCACCSRPLAPDVLILQLMATHCHFCRGAE